MRGNAEPRQKIKWTPPASRIAKLNNEVGDKGRRMKKERRICNLGSATRSSSDERCAPRSSYPEM